ncbi:MAG: putative lipid kinase [bacterium ADurb.BinA186]|nr:MAG: putative lipid kinase [bacterium ADurb.BinA186]
MYYYIFDPKKCRKKSQVEAIKDQLAKIGISGEFNCVTSLQPASELAELGIRKKYSTIVAVGADDIINPIADKLVGRGEAMGIIPLEASSEIENIIGVKGWKEAIDVLRFRRIKEINTGMTGDGRHFLTSADLDLKKPTELTIEFKGFIIQAKAYEMNIINMRHDLKKKDPEFLDIVIQSEIGKAEGLLGKITGIFSGGKILERNLTTLRARSLRVFSNKPVFVTSGGYMLSKTPQYFEATEDKLRLIVGKHIED